MCNVNPFCCFVAQGAKASAAAVIDILAAAHGLAPWALHQQVRLILFIFVLPKEPRQVQLLSLVFWQLYLLSYLVNALTSNLCFFAAQVTKASTTAFTGV